MEASNAQNLSKKAQASAKAAKGSVHAERLSASSTAFSARLNDSASSFRAVSTAKTLSDQSKDKTVSIL
jgi:hypothetical protein